MISLGEQRWNFDVAFIHQIPQILISKANTQLNTPIIKQQDCNTLMIMHVPLSALALI